MLFFISISHHDISSGQYSFSSNSENKIYQNNFFVIPQADVVSSQTEDVLIRLDPWELVHTVLWTPDENKIVATAGDRLYVISYPEMQQISKNIIGAFSPGLTINPEGSKIATGSKDGVIRVWDFDKLIHSSKTTSSKADFSFLAHKKGVNVVLFSPYGDMLISGGNDAMVRLWDVESYAQKQQIIGGSYVVPDIAFQPDQRIVAIVNGNFIRLRDVDDGRITGTFKAQNPLYSIAFSPDGLWIAASSNQGEVVIWKVDQAFRTGSSEYPIPVIIDTQSNEVNKKKNSFIWQIKFSPDGRYLAVAGSDSKVKMIDFASRRIVTSLVGHQKAVTCLAFSPDGKRLATGGLDGTIRIWDIH